MSDHPHKLRIGIVSPAAADSQSGNGVTARRWADILHGLGHEARIVPDVGDSDFDVLVALHARKSAGAIAAFRDRHSTRPIILALTGTDLYGPIDGDETSLRSLERADCLIVLQPNGLVRLPPRLRERTHVIRQSVAVAATRRQPPADHFHVILLAHLRDVKDPLLAAAATRLLPAESRIRVRHFGSALDDNLAERALAETRENPRYQWLGELPRNEALAELAKSHLLVLTSKSEGGANVVSEAIVLGVPIISTRIEGSIGMLGHDYEGYFPVGDAQRLARQMRQAETDPEFLARLRHHVESLQDLYHPRHEIDAWRTLLQCAFDSAARSANVSKIIDA